MLELSFCKKRQTSLGNRGHLKILNDTKLGLLIMGVTYVHLGLICYHSKPSHVPYFPNQFLCCDFFCRFLQQGGSNTIILDIITKNAGLKIPYFLSTCIKPQNLTKKMLL